MEQLERFGLLPYRQERSNTRYYFPPSRDYVVIPQNANAEEVLKIIYDHGVRDGLVAGSREKSEEIKSVLGIE